VLETASLTPKGKVLARVVTCWHGKKTSEGNCSKESAATGDSQKGENDPGLYEERRGEVGGKFSRERNVS